MVPLKCSHPLLSIITSSLVDLPTPASISYMWNFGSLLGGCLGVQLITGIFLAMHYSCDTSLAFESISHMSRDVNYGWVLRSAHANGASFFFVFLYLHVGRGMYYGSFNLKPTWAVGVGILLLVQATAFLGYVLPWGQMSFWGATVITNLVSSLPVVGQEIVEWLWGGFAVDNPTLTRFFTLHFLMPFVVTALVGVHLIFLHETGSNNPLGLKLNVDKLPFHPFFSDKDLLGGVLMAFVFFVVVLWAPVMFGDPENFIPANSLVTPVHIQPEWYFLFAYAILRAIPNKLGGVIALVSAILAPLLLSVFPKSNFRALTFYPCGKLYFWSVIGAVLLLTIVGAKPVEDPYIEVAQNLSFYYFTYYFLYSFINKIWDFLLK